MPYYLLLVGSPEDIPFSFQYQLDVQYAVAACIFDSPDQYERYAQGVIDAETGQGDARAALFGVQNSDDLATQLSSTRLIAPLAQRLAAQAQASNWSIETYIGDTADKAHLARLLGGDDTPALLFTASHGVGFPSTDPRQRTHQGALVCQNWPGPVRWKRDLLADFYVSADDIADDARLLGLIAVHFACFGAGTPKLDDYPQLAPGTVGPLGLRMARSIAAEAFVARLPQRLSDIRVRCPRGSRPRRTGAGCFIPE